MSAQAHDPNQAQSEKDGRYGRPPTRGAAAVLHEADPEIPMRELRKRLGEYLENGGHGHE
jgi:hypothetical protein